MSAIQFRRIRGRVVPIRNSTKAKVVGLGISAAAATAAGSVVATRDKGTNRSPDPLFKYGSYAAQVASGVVAALPLKGKAGLAFSIGGSVALDAIAAALNANSVAHMRGSKWKKAKVFGEQQAIGTSIGYGVFGASLLARQDVRSKVAGSAIKALNTARKWLR